MNPFSRKKRLKSFRRFADSLKRDGCLFENVVSRRERVKLYNAIMNDLAIQASMRLDALAINGQ